MLWLNDQEQCLAAIPARWMEHQARVCATFEVFFYPRSVTLGEGRADSKLTTAAA